MTQRAIVHRYTPGATDDSGNPLPGSAGEGGWAAVSATRIPIWLYGSTEREALTADTEAVVAALKAMVPRTADVTESDRLGGPTAAAIVDRRGEVIEPGVLGIETVLVKRTHKQLTLSRVSA
jgi:hypothetical protein